MSLTMLLPPMCDPEDGHLLIDGGYVDNVPANPMIQKFGAANIVAVDGMTLNESAQDHFILIGSSCQGREGRPV